MEHLDYQVLEQVVSEVTDMPLKTQSKEFKVKTWIHSLPNNHA